jgi:DNA topoisomerase-6 subunit A
MTESQIAEKTLLEMIEVLYFQFGKKSEQQAFAGKGLDFVTDTYLPTRLSEMGVV